MSELQAVADDLVAGKMVHNVACPSCGQRQAWWVPGNLDNYRGADDAEGLKCYCGFIHKLRTAPPDILCAVCGDVLRQTGTTDIKFQCQGCDRTVAP